MTNDLARTLARIKLAGPMLASLRGMTPEQRGVFYTLAVVDPWSPDLRGPLLDDDSARAAECGCSVRRYRRIKAALVARGALVVSSGTIEAKIGATHV